MFSRNNNITQASSIEQLKWSSTIFVIYVTLWSDKKISDKAWGATRDVTLASDQNKLVP